MKLTALGIASRLGANNDLKKNFSKQNTMSARGSELRQSIGMGKIDEFGI
jgi:hypothetical protein